VMLRVFDVESGKMRDGATILLAQRFHEAKVRSVLLLPDGANVLMKSDVTSLGNVPLLATRYGLLDGSTLALTQGDEPPAPAGPAQVLDLGFDLEARLVTLEGPLARPVVQRHGEKPAVVAPTVGTAECYAVACRPDGKLLAVSCDDHVIRLWDMPDGR